MMREETPEDLLRSLLKTRLREGASPEAIREELAAHGCSPDQIRELASELARQQPTAIAQIVSWLPVVLGVVALGMLGIACLVLERGTLATTMAIAGLAFMGLGSLGLTFAMMIGGHVTRQNVLREHIPDPAQGAMMTPERYLYLFGLLGAGLILVLVAQSIDPQAFHRIYKH